MRSTLCLKSLAPHLQVMFPALLGMIIELSIVVVKPPLVSPLHFLDAAAALFPCRSGTTAVLFALPYYFPHRRL
ncbi:hypothetical protein TIFTF001_030246 [Ficus carica]|uniref:Uncharacterized protein n=1 Tax=Ficus carica TaxID=3494 RepID=A0AA88DSU9_FICCA|nr:hypothetical protein TIFTF001_030246 [Ficus carica]